jgi:hypothetical protein
MTGRLQPRPSLVERREAENGESRDEAIARLITTRARPVIDRVLLPYRRSGFALRPEDIDDIAATISLRILGKLRGEPEQAIERFDDYVAKLAFNAAYDFFRRRYPQRARLKSRLRYVMTRDERLSIWTSPAGTVCGLADWSGRVDAAGIPGIGKATAAMLDQEEPGQALAAILRAIGAPVPFDDLVGLVADLWSIADQPAAPAEAASVRATQLTSIETRQTLEMVWDEIQVLPVRQRYALLLNLREGEDGNGAALFVLAGVATLPALAAVLEMSLADLAAVWERLPIDDRTIAERLGITRQQVINLRKSARDRLTRRMASLQRMRVGLNTSHD